MRFVFTVVAASLLIGCDTAPTSPISAARPSTAAAPAEANGAQVFTSTTEWPMEETFFVPCANGGKGENVTLKGSVHSMLHLTVTPDFSFVVNYYDVPHLSGAGEVTGTRYTAVGGAGDIIRVAGQLGSGYQARNFLRIIGEGSAGDLILQRTFHYMINANFELVSEHESFRLECR